MISTYLRGGLGNMMFQIAIAEQLAKDNNDKACFPLQGIFNHHPVERYFDNVFNRICFAETIEVSYTYNEPEFSYNKIPYHPNMQLYGYFQSWKYFEPTVVSLFINEEFYDRVKKKYMYLLTNSLAIHVRRGDYLAIQDHLPVLSMDYYKKALEFVLSKAKIENILVFSDDIQWCKGHMYTNKPNWHYISEDEVTCLYLMSMCTHIITANSSFSWWSAFMKRRGIKVMPSVWFGPAKAHYNTKDLYPNDVIIL